MAAQLGVDAEAIDAQPARLGPEAQAVGDSASEPAMDRLRRAIDALRQQAVRPLLEQSLSAIRLDDWRQGAERAIEALQIDEHNGYGWWLLAICREKASDVRGAIVCYESALQLLPDHGEIANDLGRLAYQVGQVEVAAKLFIHFLARHPDHPEGMNNLACALRDQGRFDAAVETVRAALAVHPNEALLWNTLGTLMSEQGETATAMVFFEEALRLQPDFAKAWYNHGNARLASGDPTGALVDVDTALSCRPPAAEAAMMRLARAAILLAGETWAAAGTPMRRGSIRTTPTSHIFTSTGPPGPRPATCGENRS